jgi:cytochrome c
MLLLMVLPAAAAAQDGRALFAQRCASCHATDPAAPELPGPNLAALIGRPVGGDAAFDYSPALRKARAAGIVWDAERLVRFLEDPDEMFPGLWMGANGLRDPGERAALAAWLGGGAR